MPPLSPALQGLPHRLLGDFARTGQDPGVAGAMERACAALSRTLAALMGLDGFALLMVRALNLAREEFPWLDRVVAERDGSLTGLHTAVARRDSAEAFAGFSAVLSHFFGLLVAFIGEGLTLHLVQSVWPDAELGGALLGQGRIDMMEKAQRVQLRSLNTGVPGLDTVLGGGIPEYSFNMIAGMPGSGKTTLAQQILFANASEDAPGLYFTVLGEPPLKVLRYQQQFGFFDPAKLESALRFRHLGQLVIEQDLEAVLDAIVREVESVQPRVVVVDSFRSIIRQHPDRARSDQDLQGFVQRLALQLTSWQSTTFLVGEYQPGETQDNAVFTVADGILWLTQSVERNSVVRKIQVLKQRGQNSQPGLHTFRITDQGLQVFPRSFGLTDDRPRPRPLRRISTGVAGLDEMLGGGIPAGDSALVAGPAGSGKSALCTQFIAEGVRQGEPGVIVVFEEHPADYVSRAEGLNLPMEQMIADNMLRVIYLRPLDLSVDETLHEIREAVEHIGALRVAIDSLSGFELALAPDFRGDFRESLYRMVGALTGIGVTVLNTVELAGAFQDVRFSPHEISFLTDDLILQRYIELDGKLQKVITVVKSRRGDHSKELRFYDITGEGMVVGEALRDYRGILTGFPERRGDPPA